MDAGISKPIATHEYRLLEPHLIKKEVDINDTKSDDLCGDKPWSPTESNAAHLSQVPKYEDYLMDRAEEFIVPTSEGLPNQTLLSPEEIKKEDDPFVVSESLITIKDNESGIGSESLGSRYDSEKDQNCDYSSIKNETEILGDYDSDAKNCDLLSTRNETETLADFDCDSKEKNCDSLTMKSDTDCSSSSLQETAATGVMRPSSNLDAAKDLSTPTEAADARQNIDIQKCAQGSVETQSPNSKEDEPLQCNICNKIFSNPSNFVCHLRTHSGALGWSLSCDFCKKVFSGSNTKSDLMKHRRKHISEGKKESHRRKHASESTQEKRRRKHASKSVQEKHRSKSMGEKSFECDVCKKSFSQASGLSRHRRSHTGADEGPFGCEVCDKTFKQRRCLLLHRRTHSGEKLFECDICQTSFTGLSTLVGHRRTHTGEKPFECFTCKKTFALSSTLNRHQRIHTGERPFACNLCEKTFNQGGALLVHRRTHTGERPFECDICKKTFSVSGHLVLHQRSHTGEKPYQCDACKKAYSNSTALSRHRCNAKRLIPFISDDCKQI